MSEPKQAPSGVAFILPPPPPRPEGDNTIQKTESLPRNGTASEADTQVTEAPQVHAPPPNGGYGWLCTFCVALINAHTWGLNSSYGVFLAHYLANETYPDATFLEYAFVGGLSISCAMLVSPLATMSTRLYGTRSTLSIGAVLETAALIGASFSTRIWHLFLSQGVAFGMGMGFLFVVASVGLPAQWFTTKRSLANGLAASGSGFGGLLYALAAGAMIRTLGLAWCFRILGIVAAVVNAVCIALIRDRNKAIGSRHAAFETKLFKRPEYLLLNGYGFFSMLGYIALVFSLADYGRKIGLDSSQTALVAALLNLGQGLGRPPTGYFSDAIGRINMAAITTFFSAILILVVWILSESYGVLIFYALIGGTVSGTFWATVSPVAVEVVGLQDLPSALNLEWLVIVLPCTFSEPIALQIAEATGGYLGTQLFIGFMYVGAGLCMLILRGWKVGELNEITRLKIESLADSNASSSNATIDIDMGSTNEAARIVARRAMLKHFWEWRKV
ncbi:MFS general substrate transporter [Paramyrothecium foliicola]|nr:MFS general substrate transporter [Paramyrothecium foliicola]